jgi:hypothetical protein
MVTTEGTSGRRAAAITDLLAAPGGEQRVPTPVEARPVMDTRAVPAHPATPPGLRYASSEALASLGLYQTMVAGAETTTRQAEILTAAVIAPPTRMEGIAIGRDMLSRTLVAHDPMTAYQQKRISSPAVIIIGDIGSGKSSLIKTCYVWRPLMFKKRRVVVVDKKNRGGEGEYAELTRLFGGTPIRMTTDGSGSVLNPLDPLITNPSGHQDKMVGQRAVRALAEIAGGRELDEWEDAALRAAYITVQAAFESNKNSPILTDLIAQLGAPPAAGTPAARIPATQERFAFAGSAVAFMLERIVSSYPGLFDGQTSKDVNLESRLTTFDISQLPSEGPAVDAVVGLANAWLLGGIQRDDMLTNFVVEEGWHLMRGPNARALKENTKLARANGMAIITAIHKPSDIPPTSDGWTMFQEAQTVHLFSQARMEDVAITAHQFELGEGPRQLLSTLPPGQHLLKIGKRPEIRVEHIRSAIEIQLTNTDEAMMVGASA